jgi:hypothetical protein
MDVPMDRDPSDFPLFGFGTRWHDRLERRRRIGLLLLGIPFLAVVAIIWLRG